MDVHQRQYSISVKVRKHHGPAAEEILEMKNASSVTPHNWPSKLPYLLEPFHAPHLSKDDLQALKTRAKDLNAEIPSSIPRGASSQVKINRITDTAHPAYGESGLFAARALPPGSLILPYYGIVHSSAPPHHAAHERSDYDLWLDREAGLAVDAEKAGNEARFVNDYRGVRDRPNAEFRECWDPRIGQKCMAVFVLPTGKSSTKKGQGGIAKGEEICVSYGKGFWGQRRAEQHN